MKPLMKKKKEKMKGGGSDIKFEIVGLDFMQEAVDQ
jgi:hypothetical protein